jgi:hypothetical protein
MGPEQIAQPRCVRRCGGPEQVTHIDLRPSRDVTRGSVHPNLRRPRMRRLMACPLVPGQLQSQIMSDIIRILAAIEEDDQRAGE